MRKFLAEYPKIVLQLVLLSALMEMTLYWLSHQISSRFSSFDEYGQEMYGWLSSHHLLVIGFSFIVAGWMVDQV